jgi:hypothetical protein
MSKCLVIIATLILFYPSFVYTQNSKSVFMTVEPNTSGKSRMLRIFAYSGYQYATIEVKQE